MSTEINWKQLERVAESLTFGYSTYAFYDDLVQIALIALWQNIDKDTSLRNSIAKRRVIDEFRRLTHYRSNREVKLTMIPLTVESDDGDTFTHDDAVVVDFDQALELEELLSKFEKLQHRQIALGLLQDKTKAEIAGEMGIHPSRVSQNLTEIRKMLQS